MKKSKGKRKMIYVYVLLGLVLGLGLVVQVGGMMLPVKHRASLSRVISASPERVWAVLTDVEGHPQWRKDLNSIRVVSKEPLAWIESSSFGEIPIRVEESEAVKRLVTRIDGAKLPFGGTWTYDLAPEGTGTKLTIKEDGEVYPPMFRFLSNFIFGHTKTIEGVLNQLEAHMAKENR